MENGQLLGIISLFFEKNPPPHCFYKVGKNISGRKLKNARKLYAPFDPSEEEPLIQIDDSLFGSAKLGILITNNHLFYRLKNRIGGTVRSGKIPINNILELNIDTYKQGSDLLVNGSKVAYLRAFSDRSINKNEAAVLNNLFRLLVDSLHSNSF